MCVGVGVCVCVCVRVCVIIKNVLKLNLNQGELDNIRPTPVDNPLPFSISVLQQMMQI